MEDVAAAITLVGVLVFLAHLFVAIFSRVRIPDVLLLILIGILLGPALNWVNPRHFGNVGPVFVQIALAIMLFEGGLELRLLTLRSTLRGTLALTLLSFVTTVAVISVSTYFMVGLSTRSAVLLGVILGATAPTVVLPLVRQLNLQSEPGTILILESALTEVLSIVLALGLMEAYELGAFRVGNVAGGMISSFVLAALIGVLGAIIWAFLLNSMRNIQNSIFTTVAFLFVIFGVSEMLEYSGAVAALTYGITLGNSQYLKIPRLQRLIAREPISFSGMEKAFFSEMVFLIKTFFFVYLGLSIEFSQVWMKVLAVLLSLAIFLVRMPVVRLAVKRTTTRRDAAMMSIMAPKGLAAAVLASLPVQRDLPNGELIRDITYSVIFISIIVVSILIFLLDRTAMGRIYKRFFGSFAAGEERNASGGAEPSGGSVPLAPAPRGPRGR